jgi:osmotically inducible protein OsmC
MESNLTDSPKVASSINDVIYTAKTHTIGGRDGGSSCSADGHLDVKLSIPGTPGNSTNPE